MVAWAGITLLAGFLMCLAAIALPSLNPGTGRAVVGTIQISGMVWCLMAPVFILRPRRRQRAAVAAPAETVEPAAPAGTVEPAKAAAPTETVERAE